MTRNPSRFASLAAAPPISPSPMMTTVLPAIDGVNICVQSDLLWFVMICGIRAFNISNAIVANSAVFCTWTPLLFVSATPFGSQSSGSSGSIPAPVIWIHWRFGAAEARSCNGKRGSVTTSFELTKAVAVASAEQSARSSPSVLLTLGGTLFRLRAALMSSGVMLNTLGRSYLVSKWM